MQQQKIVLGLFDHFEDARRMVSDLLEAGTPKSSISLLANNSGSSHPGVLSNPSFALTDLESPETENRSSPPFLGAEIGAGVGGVLGVLVGAGLFAVPGIGPLVAIGWWAPMLAGAVVGGGIGGGIGFMTDRGIEDADAHLYAEGLRRGGTLVTVHVPESDVEKVTKLFHARGAVDVEKRADSWRAEGWVSFDAEAQPLSGEEIAAIRAREAAAGHTVEHHHNVRHYFDPNPETQKFAGASVETTRYAEDELKQPRPL